MIYLDNAATSYPKPPCVKDEVDRCFGEWGGNPGRSGHSMAIATSNAIYEARCKVARFLGAKREEEILFVPSATHALNIAIRAVIRPGDHILLGGMEHNAVYRPVWRLSEDGVATYTVFPTRGNILENIEKRVRSETAMLICSHVSNVTGEVFPIRKIGEWCRRRGIFFLVDASQSAGHLPIDLTTLPCDGLCAPSHKGLLGIQGAGILYFKNGEEYRDVVQGGSGSHSLSPKMPPYLPDRFEAGTLPTPAIVSMGAGVDYLTSVGVSAVEEQLTAYVNGLRGQIENMPAVKIHSPPGSSIFTFTVDGVPSEAVANALDGADICARGGYHCAPLAHRTLGTLTSGAVRLSPGPFSSPGEIPQVVDAIWSITKNRQ